MAVESLKHENQQDNVNLLLEIAKVYSSLEKLHRLGAHLWPEDEDPLLLCLDRLFDVALELEVKTPEEALALTVLVRPLHDQDADCTAPYEKLDLKIAEFASKHFCSDEELKVQTI